MKKVILSLILFAACLFSNASPNEHFTLLFQEELSGDDITPNRYNGLTYKDRLYNAKHNLGRVGFVGGIYRGQYLNSSYGKLVESGQLKSKTGFTIGANFYQILPVIINAEVSFRWDKFDEYINMNKSFAGFVSLATFPWISRGGTCIIPNIGIGIQVSSIGPDWILQGQNIKEPNDEITQALYKAGIIISIPIDSDIKSIQLIGNYYRSLFTTNQPHALNAITVGIGLSGF